MDTKGLGHGLLLTFISEEFEKKSPTKTGPAECCLGSDWSSPLMLRVTHRRMQADIPDSL